LKATETSQGVVPDSGLERTLYDLLSWMGIAESMVGILLFIGFAFLGKGLLKFSEGGYRGYLRAQLLRELKSRLFDAYSEMDYRYYLEQNTGHLINVINQQANRFLNSFNSFVAFLSKTITAVSYFAIAFALTWKFALMAVGVGVIVLVIFQRLNRYVRDLSRKTSQEMGRLNKLLIQALQAFKYISSTAQMSHLRSNVMNSIHRLTGYSFRQQAAGAFTGSLKEPLSVFFIIGIIVVQVTVMNQPIAPIFVSILLFHRGMQAVMSVQSQWQGTMDVIGSVEMVDKEYQNVVRNQEETGSRQLSSLDDRIQFDDVSFAYDEEEGPVLKEISAEIPANTTVAFVGESGAGKSTLIDLLTLLLKPQRGAVRIDGVPGSAIDLPSWRSQIGYVSQETVIFDDTIANNISLWTGDYSTDASLRDRIQDAARRAYAHSFIKALPDGYQTVVGDRGVRLSGGQRQRLFIARELFKRPNLLILDEATSALDTESERYIQQSIDALKGSMTVVIIAHRLSTIKNVDHIYVMEDGRIVEEGSYGNLTADRTRFRKMVEMQSL
jgi:subfamily B ATP-binding cassette protein MsbA